MDDNDKWMTPQDSEAVGRPGIPGPSTVQLPAGSGVDANDVCPARMRQFAELCSGLLRLVATATAWLAYEAEKLTDPLAVLPARSLTVTVSWSERRVTTPNAMALDQLVVPVALSGLPQAA